MEIGSIHTGKVTGITKFGAFVSTDAGSGMVHISEIAHTFVNDIREHLTEGQEVMVRVVSVSPEGRVNLSIKKATAPPQREASYSGARRPASPVTFEDKLKAFMSDSESKMHDLKQHSDKGGKRRR